MDGNGWMVVIGVVVLAVAVWALTWWGTLRRVERRRFPGAGTVTARDVMSRPAWTTSPSATLGEASRAMIAHEIGCLPVVDHRGRLVGLITETDLSLPHLFFPRRGSGGGPSDAGLEERYAEASHRSVAEVMTRRVLTATEEDLIGSLAMRMIEHGIHHMPVVRDGVVVGVVSRRDLLRVLAGPVQPKRVIETAAA